VCVCVPQLAAEQKKLDDERRHQVQGKGKVPLGKESYLPQKSPAEEDCEQKWMEGLPVRVHVEEAYHELRSPFRGWGLGFRV
jgi:hypothetical protein